MPNPKKPRPKCPVCGEEPARSFYKYCSNLCQRESEYQISVKKWLLGEVSGLQTTGVVRPFVKKFLRRKFGDQCSLCGWSEVNKTLGKVPLIADHIDGNWNNNVESNLRLVCPNCDALGSTYGSQ